MQFEGGFIMTIEQKAEYPGQFKIKAMESLVDRKEVQSVY
jgi:hypothetical protein